VSADGAPHDAPPLASTFVLKIAERCNLNCSYCYMYNKGDTSFLGRPKFMSSEVAEAMLHRIAAYARRHEIDEIILALHGGEPLLAGRDWVGWFLDRASGIGKDSGVSFAVAIQTNGTLLDADWLELLSEHDVRVGVSCDGPQEVHDAARVDFGGRGSYAEVRRALELLAQTYGSEHWGVLTVANPEVPGSMVLRHFAEIGTPRVDFLWPDYQHDDPPPWSPGTLGAYYCELFDYWYDELESPPGIRWFESAISLLTGGSSRIDTVGPQPITDIMVESDGTWEPLDSLRICGNGITRTGLDVREQDVEAIWDVPLYRIGLYNQELLPAKCRACAFRNVCGGGYISHRYRSDTGFANTSVHCEDLIAVLAHIRARVEADLREASLIAAGS
jgi:uncharacterized protein